MRAIGPWTRSPRKFINAHSALAGGTQCSAQRWHSGSSCGTDNRLLGTEALMLQHMFSTIASRRNALEEEQVAPVRAQVTAMSPQSRNCPHVRQRAPPQAQPSRARGAAAAHAQVTPTGAPGATTHPHTTTLSVAMALWRLPARPGRPHQRPCISCIFTPPPSGHPQPQCRWRGCAERTRSGSRGQWTNTAPCPGACA